MTKSNVLEREIIFIASHDRQTKEKNPTMLIKAAISSFLMKGDVSLKKFTTIPTELEQVAHEFNVPVQHQRFWLWEKCQNHIYRPLMPEEETQSVNTVFCVLVTLDGFS